MGVMPLTEDQQLRLHDLLNKHIRLLCEQHPGRPSPSFVDLATSRAVSELFGSPPLTEEMEMTDLEILRWVREQTDADIPLGEFHGMTDYGHPQRTLWSCGGCDGEGEAVWPRWELKFNHKPDCKWLAFKQRTEPPSHGKELEPK